MTWWDAVKNWFAGKRSGSFPVPGEGTPDRETEYNGATEWLAKRANLTTVMNSREIAEEWTAKARAQAFFSARVAEGHILERLRSVSDAFSRGEIGLAEARTELKRFLRAEGKDDGKSGLRNLASTARLNLILEQNARMAAAVGQYQAGMDPDILERFPCWRYIGSTALNPRDSHARFAGKVFRKDDPIWHKIFPPSDFNCKCSVEDCDDEPDRAPEKIDPPESGFAFDPAHAFESFDLSAIRNETFRNRVAETLETKYNMSLGDKLKAFFRKEKKKDEPPDFDAPSLERAQMETRKILPGAHVDLRGIVDKQAINRMNRCIDKVKRENGLDDLKVIMTDSLLNDSVPGTYTPKTGIFLINPKLMNNSEVWKKFKIGKYGEYEGVDSNIYAGKEVESIVLHELYHSVSEHIIAKPGGERKRKILRECLERAEQEGFFISAHGMSDEHEFFSELKTGKALANRSYPDYIEETLREFLL